MAEPTDQDLDRASVITGCHKGARDRNDTCIQRLSLTAEDWCDGCDSHWDIAKLIAEQRERDAQIALHLNGINGHDTMHVAAAIRNQAKP